MEVEFKVTLDVVGEDTPEIRADVRKMLSATLERMGWDATKAQPDPFWMLRGTDLQALEPKPKRGDLGG